MGNKENKKNNGEKYGFELDRVLIVVMPFIISATEATVYNVGDSFGWNTPTNENFYSNWASTKRFFVGDKLIFNWTGTHTVGDVGGDVSKADNDDCNTAAIISPFGGSGNVTVPIPLHLNIHYSIFFGFYR